MLPNTGGPVRPVPEAVVGLWQECREMVRGKFGPALSRSYVDPLDLAFVDEAGSVVMLARNGATQKLWIEETLWPQIESFFDAHGSEQRKLRLATLSELSPIERDVVAAEDSQRAAASRQIVTEFRPKWRGTFDTFCVGPSNAKAVRIMQQFAENPLGGLDIALIWGDPGTGKTHLAEAVANEALARNPELKVELIGGQRFSETFIDLLKNRRDELSAFKARIRRSDILIIDDVPRVAGRVKTEEEIYDSMVSVAERGGTVILTSSISPASLSGFGERLAHHIRCAPACEIGLPDLDLRRRILDKRVAFYAASYPGFAVDADALDMIAEKMPVSGRELDGAIRQLTVERAGEDDPPISLAAAESALRAKIAEPERRITVDHIKAAVARRSRLTVQEMMRRTRERSVSHPRQLAMYLTTQLTTHSLPNIGRLFGGFDHTTVLYSKRKIKALIDKNEDVRREVEELTKIIRQSV